MKMSVTAWRERLAQSLLLPGDLAYEDAIITLTGNREILLENYTRILDYHENLLLVQTKRCCLRIQGQQLKILSYTTDEMKVSGVFECISYE